MDFQKKAADDPNIDLKFDALLKEEVAAAGGNCVITTWLGPWVINADVSVYIDAPPEVRAKRISGRDKMSEKRHLHILTSVMNRTESDILRCMELIFTRLIFLT